jgi:ribonuclease HI
MPGWIMNVDGGSRGNPGPAGGGVVICDDAGGRAHEGAYFFGRHTNNAAEYLSLLRGLERLAKLERRAVVIRSDSELLVRQLTGEYRVKSPALLPLFEQAQLALLRLGGWSVRHVRREENSRADELANLAMDRRRDVVVFDIDGGSEDEDDPPAASAAADAQPSRAAGGVRAVRFSAQRSPASGACPAGSWCDGAMTFAATLPPGVCVQAALAMLPTIVAIQNTDAQEVGSLPTMTVRCMNPQCGATFLLAAETPTNGR